MTRAHDLLRQALNFIDDLDFADPDAERDALITAIREYLDKTAEQEPVAWMQTVGNATRLTTADVTGRDGVWQPLYLHPKGDE